MYKELRHLLFIVCLTIISLCIAPTLAYARQPAQTSELSGELTTEERQWLTEHPNISVAYDGFFPPYSFLNDENKLEGYSIDLFERIGARLGINLTIHPRHTWENLYQDAQNFKVDIVATMVEREGRTEWFEFTKPYIDKSLVVITRADDELIQRKADLKNKTVALVKSYQSSQKVITDFPGAKPLYVENIVDAFTAVSLGDADAAVSFLSTGHFYRTKYLFNNLKFAALYDKNSSSESIAIRKDWPLLASIMRKALKSIPLSELQSLKELWLPVEYLESLVSIDLTRNEIQWIKQHPDIRLGTDPEFAPFEFTENGRYKGMASDYIRVLNQRLNLSMTVVANLSWHDAVEKAKVREIDVLPAVGKTQERLSYLNYTEPYLSFHRVIITQLGAPFMTGLDDLRNKKVAVQKNSSHHDYLKENSNLEIVPYDTLKDAVLAVSGGKAYAFVGNVASTTYWIRKLNLSNLKIAAPVSNEVQSLHFAVRKDWPELVSILQKGLKSISPSQQKRISEKWMSIEHAPDIDMTLIWKVSGVFCIFFIGIILWNILLKRTVKQRTSELLYSAHYDKLTNLPNRFLMQDRLSQRILDARNKDEKIALFSIDLDDFKKINDSYGHDAGDALLKEVVMRLSKTLTRIETMGRIGGNQFLILHDINETEEAVLIVNRLSHCFSQSFKVEDREFVLTASIGIAVFPYDGESSAELLKNSEAAAHHAKEKVGGTHVFFTENLNQKMSRRLTLEEHMSGALQRDEFYLAYQPKIDSKTNLIVGFEALLRWHNEVLGNVSPAEFIPVAEVNGLIEPIGKFVINQATYQLAEWRQIYDKKLIMAINISPVQFKSKQLALDIQQALNSNNIPYHQLEIEITEGVLLKGFEDTQQILNKLLKQGIRLAMDDFGTGYSSMSSLRRFKFHTLKIDREFIVDLPHNQSDRELVSATIAMAHGLGMQVVAEGVETAEQQAFLVKQGTDVLQGWLFGKAEKPDKVKELFEKQTLQESINI